LAAKHSRAFSHSSVFFPISLPLFLMVDHPDILGIPTGAPISVQKKQAFNFKEFCKACLSIVTRWHRFKRKSSPTSPGEEELEAKFEAISHGPEVDILPCIN
jgi:hypothetical protein